MTILLFNMEYGNDDDDNNKDKRSMVVQWLPHWHTGTSVVGSFPHTAVCWPIACLEVGGPNGQTAINSSPGLCCSVVLYFGRHKDDNENETDAYL